MFLYLDPLIQIEYKGLNKYNSKTGNIENFQEYITAKIEANEILVKRYLRI